MIDLGGQIASDARRLVKAEIAVQRARIADKATSLRSAALFMVPALVLVCATLGALLVGIIMTLTPRVGPGWATTIVVVGSLIVAGVLALLGKRHLAALSGIGA